jgi:hypothetical protein
MSGFPTISPIFGIIFALAGLALAVVLGLVLYQDVKQETASVKESFNLHEEGNAA